MFVSPVFQGAPSDATGHSEKAMATYRMLNDLHIPFLRVSHDAAETMELCAPVDAALGTSLCKNLFLCNRQQTVFYLLLLRGEKVFHTKELSAQLGVSRLSFGTAQDMERLLGACPGSLSVMGLMHDTRGAVQLLIDSDLSADAYLSCHPLDNRASLRLSMQDLLHIFLPATHHAPRYVSLSNT